MIVRGLLFAAASSVVLAQGGYRIYADCDDASEVRAEIQKDAELSVRFAIAGSSTCYSVIANVGGNEVRGFVLDRNLDAVQNFENARAKTETDSFESARLSALRQPAVDPPKTAPPPPAVKVVAEKPKPVKKEPTPHVEM